MNKYQWYVKDIIKEASPSNRRTIGISMFLKRQIAKERKLFRKENPTPSYMLLFKNSWWGRKYYDRKYKQWLMNSMISSNNPLLDRIKKTTSFVGESFTIPIEYK